MNLRLMTNNVAEKFRVAVSDGQFLFSPSHSAQLGKEFALPLKGVGGVGGVGGCNFEKSHRVTSMEMPRSS